MGAEADNDIYVRSSASSFVVEAKAIKIGADILIYIWGGSRPHIGAVAAAQPRPSLADISRTSATSSVLTYPGHKEDEVVKMVSERLSAELNTNVVVTAGIHWDDLGHSDIRAIGSRIKDIIFQLTTRLTEQENAS